MAAGSSETDSSPQPAKSSWYDKYLQHVEYIKERDREAARSTTSLSPHVYHLVTQSIPPSLDKPDHLLDNDLTINWPLLNNYLNPLLSYDDLVEQLGVIAYHVHRDVSSIEVKDLIEKWSHLFEWTHSPSVIIACIELVSNGQCHLSLTLLTAALEHSLGDAYLWLSSATHCPHFMKDILSTVELAQVFGDIPVQCLSGLVGPPAGLNLRNIVWHGFAAPNEIPSQYVYLLLVLVASLGKILKHKFSSFSDITRRSCVTFSSQELILSNIFPNYSAANLDQVVELFEKTYFIIPSMLPIWKSALSSFKNEKYGHCLCLLLPALEHSCRRVFAYCNDCPQRVLTAESTKLYTTFDEILSPSLVSDGSVDNKFIEEIGPEKMQMLLDLLEYPEGPRLRDRLSHGEVELSSITRTLAGHVLSMCISFSLQYSINFKSTKLSIFDKIKTVSTTYTSLFHPSTLLKRQLLKLIVELEKWNDILSFSSSNDENDLLVVSTQPHSNYVSTLSHLLDSFPYSHSGSFVPDLTTPFRTEPLASLVNETWAAGGSALFLSRNGLEIIGILRQQTDHLVIAIGQIRNTSLQRYESYQQKCLRSRQRNNFDRLLSHIGVYWYTGVLDVCLTCLVMALVVFGSHDCCHKSRDKIVKFLKKVLQLSENFQSQTSSSRNRWEEAEKLCSAFIDSCSRIPVMEIT